MKSLVYLFLAFATTASATSPVDVCLLPFKITGPQCLAYLPRFHFNWQSGRCEAFFYGGCGGNANMFHSLQECHERCKHLVKSKMEHVKSSMCIVDPLKSMRVKPVGREPSSTRFTFNLDTLSCEPYPYGGCKPRPNVFRTWGDCRSTCVYDEHDALPDFRTGTQLEGGAAGNQMLSSICHLPPVNPALGLECDVLHRFWTYNSLLQKCVEYSGYGCSVTENRFLTMEKCYEACPRPSTPDLCRLPKVVGHCRAAFPRFTFNPKHGRCEFFSYGGCGGNENNFYTPDECLDVCGGTEPGTNAACEHVRCNREELALHKAKGCTPFFSSPDECCPNAWNCPLWDQWQQNNNGTCFYTSEDFPEGKRYGDGEYVPSHRCRPDCTCSARPGLSPQISCPITECGWKHGDGNYCVKTYDDPKQCCPSETNCYKSVEDVTFLCELDGHLYAENQRIYPKKDPCKVCHCKSGWQNRPPLEHPNHPFCYDVDCDLNIRMEELARGCTPVYRDDVCCPIDWNCP